MSAENAGVVGKTRKKATWAFFVTASGEKVRRSYCCWKESQPTLLQAIKGQFTFSVSAIFFSSSKTWMASEIFAEILSRLNRRMDCEGHHILLFLDNAPCHPSSLIDRFWNMKMAFLSKKTTSPHNP